MPSHVMRIANIRADLEEVKTLVDRWKHTFDWDMEHSPDLDTETIAVWGTYHSAIIAYHVSKTLTEINLVAVKENHQLGDNSTTQREWARIVRNLRAGC